MCSSPFDVFHLKKSWLKVYQSATCLYEINLWGNPNPLGSHWWSILSRLIDLAWPAKHLEHRSNPCTSSWASCLVWHLDLSAWARTLPQSCNLKEQNIGFLLKFGQVWPRFWHTHQQLVYLDSDTNSYSYQVSTLNNGVRLKYKNSIKYEQDWLRPVQGLLKRVRLCFEVK